MVVPDKALAKLRGMIIELDLNYGGLSSMQYPPSAGLISGLKFTFSEVAKTHVFPTAALGNPPFCS